MRILIIFLVALTSCALTYEVNPSYTTKPRAAIDYTGNLIDEWVANRGYAITYTDNNTLNIHDYTTMSWSGNVNNIKLTSFNAPIAPNNYIQPSDANDYYTFSTTITGSITVAIIIRKPVASTTVTTIFDSNTNAPQCKLLLRISASNPHMGISYNGVIHDCGATFTYDNSFHQLIYKVDGPNNTSSIWIDGTKSGSDMPLTGGGLNCNTGQLLYFFRNAAGSYYLAAADLKKIRLYSEAIPDTEIQTLLSGDFSQDIVDNTGTILYNPGGQSNNSSPAPDNYITYYPDSLRLGFPDVYMFNWAGTNTNYFFPMPANTQTFIFGSYPVSVGPNLAIAYELRRKFPTYNLRICEMYKASTALYDTWNASTPTSLYNTRLKPACKNAYTLLKRVEQRNVVMVVFHWTQGEQDANYDYMANAYFTNLCNLAADFRSNVDPNTVVIITGLNTRMQKPYGDIVIQAQKDFVALDTMKNKFIDTEDSAKFPLYSNPPIHYTRQGEISIGIEGVKFVKP